MAADSSAPALPAGESGSTKIRIRFRKGGDLRFVSHHDLMHCFERMLRRTGLPLLCTQGFNPHPRIVFPLSLALGIAGQREVVEIEFVGTFTAEEIHARLAPHTPPGIDIVELRVIERRTRGQARLATYNLALPPAIDLASLQIRIAALLAQKTHIVERTRPERKRIDLRPYIKDVRLNGPSLEIDTWITPNGAARGDELLQAFGLQDVVGMGAVLERSDLKLIDEIPKSELDECVMPTPEPSDDTNELNQFSQESTADSEPPKHRQPTPLFSGPLSFDS